MKQLRIKPQYLLLPNELDALQALPAAAPDAKYGAADQRHIRNIYYRLFGEVVDGSPATLAQKDKWDNNSRKSEVAAMRQCIDAIRRMPQTFDPAEDVTLLINTMRAGSPLYVMLGGMCLEAYDVPAPEAPKTVHYMIAFNKWATEQQLTDEQIKSFFEAIRAQELIQGIQ